jgi:GT2 family glycosyltransferase
MRTSPQISIILSTYQQPQHLSRSLTSLAHQKGVDGRFEVVVADDGSDDETAELVARFAHSANFPVKFTTHDHQGYRIAACLNEGAMAAAAPYLLFSHGDCIFPPNHLARHLRVRRPGVAWTGDCFRLDEEPTSRIDEAVLASGEFLAWVRPKERRRIYKRWIKDRFYQAIRHKNKPTFRGCNIAVWRSDFERVNGYDENFIGWGCEDNDLAERLRLTGVRIATILGHTHVYHLWHPFHATQPNNWSNGLNVDYLKRQGKVARCEQGISAHRSKARSSAVVERVA